MNANTTGVRRFVGGMHLYAALTLASAVVGGVCFALNLQLQTMMIGMTGAFLATLLTPSGRRILGLERGHDSRTTSTGSRTGKNVLIYGAGSAGERLARYLRFVEKVEPVAFVDDAKELVGQRVANIRVFSAKELPYLVNLHDVGRIVIAMPHRTCGID